MFRVVDRSVLHTATGQSRYAIRWNRCGANGGNLGHTASAKVGGASNGSRAYSEYSHDPPLERDVMSYEDTNCPCGGKKERDTMLCDRCESDLAQHPSMPVFKNLENALESRRHAAIVLLSLSRGLGRKRQLTPP